MIAIDGSEGEGGGQILRTSLALSLVTGQPFRMQDIRCKRQKPGLLRQHLTAVEAAKAVGCADVVGGTLNSQKLEFVPRTLSPGNFRFAVGTAGSATLVLQTVLPALLTASEQSILTLEGGTHNPLAPPFDFLEMSFVPLLRRMGPLVDLDLKRPGFFPAGGGRFLTRVTPVKQLKRFDLINRGSVKRQRARIWNSKLPETVAERELTLIREELRWPAQDCNIETVQHPLGPGNAVVLSIETDEVAAVFTGFGQRGRPAEQVAQDAVEAAKTWLEADVPVDEHLADQLLIPMALAAGGSFRTTRPSLHTTTNAKVIQQFLAVSICFEQESDLAWRACIG